MAYGYMSPCYTEAAMSVWPSTILASQPTQTLGAQELKSGDSRLENILAALFWLLLCLSVLSCSVEVFVPAAKLLLYTHTHPPSLVNTTVLGECHYCATIRLQSVWPRACLCVRGSHLRRMCVWGGCYILGGCHCIPWGQSLTVDGWWYTCH